MYNLFIPFQRHINEFWNNTDLISVNHSRILASGAYVIMNNIDLISVNYSRILAGKYLFMCQWLMKCETKWKFRNIL